MVNVVLLEPRTSGNVGTIGRTIVALGGAGKIGDLKDAYKNAYATGLAAGSMFVYHGAKRGVLINYPEKSELNFK